MKRRDFNGIRDLKIWLPCLYSYVVWPRIHLLVFTFGRNYFLDQVKYVNHTNDTNERYTT